MTLSHRRGNSRVALALLAAIAASLAAPPGALSAEAAPVAAGQGAAAPAPEDTGQAAGAETPGVFGKLGRAITAGARSVGDWLGGATEGEGEAAAQAGAAPVAATDPNAPTLANARWIGFAPAVYTGADPRPGVWIAGPFDREQRTGWIADTATGATARVTLIWREAGQGDGAAALSEAAVQALGLRQGDVANIAVYLSR